MAKSRIALNFAVKDNIAFFDPDSGLHLSILNPVGFTDRVTSSIKRGIVAKTLLDIDNLLSADTNEVATEKEVKPIVDNKDVTEKKVVTNEESVSNKRENITKDVKEKVTNKKSAKAKDKKA